MTGTRMTHSAMINRARPAYPGFRVPQFPAWAPGCQWAGPSHGPGARHGCPGPAPLSLGPARVTDDQQSGQCSGIYITNMQNIMMNPALFCILILGFTYYLASYWCIYMQNNMHNMQNNMQENSAGFIFCIFCILQYAEYAEYVK